MLAYRIWLETRTRFFLGLAFVAAISLFFVLGQPFILAQWALEKKIDPDLEDAWWMPQAIADYRYFIWHFLYNYLLQNVWVMFTVILALGGLKNEYEQGSSLFTLSLPITRQQLFVQRVLIGFAEATALSLVPALILPLGSVFIHQQYGLDEALFHAFSFVVGGTVFYALAVFLNTVVKTDLLPFSILMGLIVVFYVVFPPDSENIAKPYLLSLVDLQSLMAGRSGDLAMPSWRMMGGCLFTAAGLLLWSFHLLRKRDF